MGSATAYLVWILWTSSVPFDEVEWRPGDPFSTQQACERDAARLRRGDDGRQKALRARLDAENRRAKAGSEQSMLSDIFTCYPHTFDPRPPVK